MARSRIRHWTSVAMKGSVGPNALVPLVVVLAVAASACGGGAEPSAGPEAAAPEPEKSTFVVGVPACTTGSLSVNFIPGASAAEAWEQWTNARGGINGHPVKVVVRDDGCDGARSLAAVRALVENEKALVLVPSTAAESAWADYLAGRQVPAISGASTFNPIWGTAEMLFPVVSVSPHNTRGAIRAAKEGGAQKVRQLVCAEVPACKEAGKVWEEYAPTIGLEYDGTVTVAATQPNFTAVCLDAKNSGVDFLAMGVGPSVGTRVVADCQKQGYNPMLGVTGSGLTTDYLAIPNITTIGAQLAFPWFGDFEETRGFREAMAEYAQPSDLTGAATGVWTGLTMFAKVAESLPDDATPADVLDALYQVENETLGGLTPEPLTYTKGSGAPATPTCVFFAGIVDGEYDAPKGLETSCP